MSERIDTDVVIVGAGPVGLTLALYLAQQGINVTVLEKDAVLNDSPRAMVYLHPVLADLDEIGMLEPMLEVAWLDREGFNLHLPDLDEVISVPNTALEGIDEHPYNLHLGQGEYCRLAREQLTRYPSVRVVFGAEVVAIDDGGDRVSATALDGEQYVARWLVGADGGHSVVRAGTGASLEGFTWDTRFVATNVRYDFRSRGFKSSNMYVDDEIGCIIAQITPDGLWRCTYQETLALPEETAGERIATHFVKLLGPEEAAKVDVVAYRPYRMHQRLASTLRSGRVVLAGDAAHLTNPTGGLGLTTGLTDVFLLQEVLIAILTKDGDEALLDAYAAERARVFREQSSPNATNFKRLVYDSRDPVLLDRAVQPFREAASTLEGQRAFLQGLDSIRSPHLVVAT